MLVAALSPEALIASRNRGKTRGGTITIGWRAVRITERQAIYLACLGRDVVATAPNALLLRGHRGLWVLARLLLGGLVAGALQRAPGLGEEDIVEARRVELQVRDRDPLVVESADDVGELLRPLGQPHGGGPAGC